MKMIVRQVSKNGYMMELIPAAIKEPPKSNWLEWVKGFVGRLVQ